jgi:ABC-type transport system involved in multi-copper enzyme maturation permease subunit
MSGLTGPRRGQMKGERGGGLGSGPRRRAEDTARISGRRVRAIFRKELREYRRSRTVVTGMAILPLLFLVQPLVSVFALPASASSQLASRHELLYLLAIPALVPATLAAYAVVSERQQGTLEPVLTTPVRREEFLLGKALACFVPSVAIAYAVFALFLACVELFARPGVAPALLRGSDLLAQLVFTPLLAGWSIWLGMAISTRASEIRVAQQLGLLANLPSVAVTTLIAFNVIHASRVVAIGGALVLLVLNRLGWRITSALFDRERLITGTR